MRLAMVEHARDLGIDARDLVRLVSAPRRPLRSLRVSSELLAPLLNGLRVRHEPAARAVGATTFRRAADVLDEYAAALASLVESDADPTLALHLDVASSWGARVWHDPRGEGESVLAELQPTIDRLVGLRTQLILGRPARSAAGEFTDD